MGAPGKERLQTSPAAHEQRSRALRPMHFMPRNTQQIAPNRLHLDSHLAGRLHRIHMKSNPGLAGNASDLRHRL